MMHGQLFAYPLYTQVDLDSGTLVMKCFIAHLLREQGLYHGTVMLGERFVAGFVIEVNETAEETQATVDLSELHFGARGTAPNEVVKRFAVKTGGYMVLHVGQGEGGYHVLLRSTDDDRGRPWNSQRLEADDIFSVIPLRPGSYTLSNVASENAVATRLVVTYPDPRENTKDRPRPTPFYANFKRRRFDPEAFTLDPGQGIVIATKDPARFTLTLDQPDDGSDEIREWHEQQRAELFRMIRGRRAGRGRGPN